MGKLLKIFKISYRMSAITRYSQSHMIKNESVLEHTGFVCFFSYYISLKAQKEGMNISIGEVMRKAVTHDIDEIVTGDIPHPTKYYNEETTKAIKAIEKANMRMIADDIMLEEIFQDWSSAKDGIEGVIVAISDAMAILYKTYYETSMFGNLTMLDHFNLTEKTLVNLRTRVIKEHKIPEESILVEIINEGLKMCQEINVKFYTDIINFN